MSDDAVAPHRVNDANARATIADRIHEAVSSLLDTESRLNTELNEAREIAREQKREIEMLRAQLNSEHDIRSHFERLLSQISDLVKQQ